MKLVASIILAGFAAIGVTAVAYFFSDLAGWDLFWCDKRRQKRMERKLQETLAKITEEYLA